VGHLAPGLALREALAVRGVEARFATPGEAHERTWFPEGEPAPLRIPAPRRPRGLAEAPLFPVRASAAVARAVAVLRRERPAAVVALGGWPCVPAALAAALLRVPLAFVASDRTPGVVVRRLAPLADRVYVADERAAADLGDGARVRTVGPVLRAAMRYPRRDPGRFGLRSDRATLVVVGGSLGARGLNERVAAGLAAAARETPALRDRFQVLHSVGRSGDGVAQAYRLAGLLHHVTPFLRDMEVAWGTADLAVTRAGAVTCAELAATGTPAVLVPYPHHADRQQFRNAEPLVARGAATLVEEGDLAPERVRRDVVGLLLDPARLSSMRSAVRSGFRDGAGQIADDLVRFLGGGRARSSGAVGWCRADGR
jgi:UDP-N-acetylglucosamine--N-acetylmuramyl-(pentapeptide) pyrophosphoryl-undecaprenol N-acetylglucosamine transferase